VFELIEDQFSSKGKPGTTDRDLALYFAHRWSDQRLAITADGLSAPDYQGKATVIY